MSGLIGAAVQTPAVQTTRRVAGAVARPVGTIIGTTWQGVVFVAKQTSKVAITGVSIGLATGTLRHDHYTIPQHGTLADPVQQQQAKMLNFARGTTVDAYSVPLPVADKIGGRAWVATAAAPAVWFPPGLPGQQGTAQIAFAKSISGRLFGGPSALMALGYAYVGVGAGTPNAYATEGLYAVGPNAGVNLPVLRGGVAPDPFRPGQTTNPFDAGAALSIGPARLGYTLNANVGPVTVNIVRATGPVYLTTDATTGGTLVKPFRGLQSLLTNRVGFNGSFDPKAADWQAAKTIPGAAPILGQLERLVPPSAAPKPTDPKHPTR